MINLLKIKLIKQNTKNAVNANKKEKAQVIAEGKVNASDLASYEKELNSYYEAVAKSGAGLEANGDVADYKYDFKQNIKAYLNPSRKVTEKDYEDLKYMADAKGVDLGVYADDDYGNYVAMQFIQNGYERLASIVKARLGKTEKIKRLKSLKEIDADWA